MQTNPTPPLRVIAYAGATEHVTRRPGFRFWPTAGRIALQTVCAAASLGAFCFLFGLMSTAALLMPLALIAGVALTIVTAACVKQVRAGRGKRVLRYVADAVRLELPLPNLLRAAATVEQRVVANRLRAVADSLEAGAPLAAALASGVKELPARATAVLVTAEAHRTVPETLDRLTAPSRADEAASGSPPGLSLAYALALMTALSLVGSLMSVFVLPRITEIFADYKYPMSPAWVFIGKLGRGTFDFSTPSMPFVGLILSVFVNSTLLLIGLLTLVVVVRSWRTILWARHDLGTPFQGFFDRLKWYAPLIGPATQDQHYVDACHAFADGLTRSRPMDVVTADLAEATPNRVLRRKLARWTKNLSAGTALAPAGRAAGLPDTITGLVGTHASAETFRFLARYYQGRCDRRWVWLSAAATPALTIGAGLIVGYVVLSFYGMVWKLIDLTLPKNPGW